LRWIARLTLGAAGLLTISITQLAVAHTGHPHGAADEPPVVVETEAHSSPLHADAQAQEIAHPYEAVVVSAVQVDFSEIAALTDASALSRLKL